MRIRTIKPEFWTSLTITALPLEERLTFIGLWNVADDEGRGLSDVRLLKASIWPVDDLVEPQLVEQMLEHLAEVGLIVMYDDDAGHALFQVRSWTEHQSISKPKPSKYAAPQDASGTAPGQLQDESGTAPGALQDESTREGKGKEGKGKEGNREGKGKELEPKGAPTNSATPDHDQFYLAEKLTQEFSKHRPNLGPAALQKLNSRFGRERVTNAMRQLRGFPPEDQIRSPYAYLEAMLTMEVERA